MMVKRAKRNQAAASRKTSKKRARHEDDEPLDAHDFEIRIKPVKTTGSRKRKHSQISTSDDFDFQLDLAGRLEILPAGVWENVREYKTFIVEPIHFQQGSIVEVKRPADHESTESRPWVARVLQIKASDSSHVYLRVAWFYWPDELPMGRQDYHGVNELIESNHPDIIDAMSIENLADIKEWDESNEDEELSAYYYRQKFDYPTQQLSAPRTICVCGGYQNPDTRILQCQSCKTWLHEDCITADAMRRHYKPFKFSRFTEKLRAAEAAEAAEAASKSAGKQPKKGSTSPETKPVIKAETIRVEPQIAVLIVGDKIRIKEQSKNHDRDSDSGLDLDTITDEAIHCLNCDEVVE
ncbi:hypothetical protein TWF694_008610 [Orbilia ellipsospora]|uniref:BAH domain-containing protein n=1 Tax=Orbilia ellipsospora TaxID=2528407 RepID=A0AAV9XJ95_9PEZI